MSKTESRAPTVPESSAAPTIMSVVNLRPRKLGSFETYTIALSQALTRAGGRSVLVFGECPPQTLREPYDRAGATIETKPFRDFAWTDARALRTLLRRHRPHVVHFHFVNMLSLDLLAAALWRSGRVVYSEHSSDRLDTRSSPRQAALRLAKRAFAVGVDRVVAPSNYVRRRLVREGLDPETIQTIHNGVSLDRFAATQRGKDVRRQFGLAPDTLLVTSSALLIPEKGIGYLVEAASEVVRAASDVQFVHIGDGPCLDQYRARVAELGLSERFKFAGLLNLTDIAAVLGQTDVFTLPCVWGEAFSLVILEAMAAGKPVIATRLGGNVEAVEDGKNGLLVPPRDPKALAHAILALRNNPEQRRAMAEEGRRRSAYFSLDRWVQETIALYQHLLHGGTHQ